MAKNENLTKARAEKNDEFYTQFDDIQREMNAYIMFDRDVFRGKTVLLPCDDPEWSNFTKFFVANFAFYGLKKLISTSYAPAAVMRGEAGADPRGRVFVLEADENGDGRVDMNDLKWEYLEGDGDFRSAEVTALRDEADFVITNPPFSIFREFLAWIMEGGKKFAMITSKNCVTYKEVFPLIKDNLIWSGREEWSGGMWFRSTSEEDADKIVNGVPMRNVPAMWLTNIEHGRRHQPLPLMSASDNLRFNPKMAGKTAYDRYDNYDAIEVPATKAIPSDYEGFMGVPITFMDKYCPEQFEIVGATESEGKGFSMGLWHGGNSPAQATVNGKRVFKRIFIKNKVAA